MKMDLNRAIDVLGVGVWQDAHAFDGTAMTRIPTGDMTGQQIAENMRLLKKAGFSPRLHQSETLGQTIRLEGIDALNVHIMRRGLIAQENWQAAKSDDGIISRVATRGMESCHLAALNNALMAEHIEPLSLQSEKLGPTLRLEGKDVGRLLRFQKDYSPDKLQLIDKPKDDIVRQFMRAFNDVAAKAGKFVDGLKPKPEETPPEPHFNDPKNFARFMPAVKPPGSGK